MKRKIVKNSTGKLSKWWFVIHDTEEVLTNLESKWDQLKLETLWELEPCYMSGQVHENSPNQPLDTAESDINSSHDASNHPPLPQSQQESNNSSTSVREKNSGDLTTTGQQLCTEC